MKAEFNLVSEETLTIEKHKLRMVTPAFSLTVKYEKKTIVISWTE